MRARLIKQDFWKSETVARLTFFERLLFEGLWCLADKRGVLKWSARRAKAELFPYDDVLVSECLTGVRHMSDIGLVTQYRDAQGAEYVHVKGFTEHQTISTAEKRVGELAGPLPHETGCEKMNERKATDTGQTCVSRVTDTCQSQVGHVSVDTDTDTDTEAEKGDIAMSDTRQTENESVVLAELFAEFREAHDECGRIPDFVFAELVKGEGLSWQDAEDAVRIREAVSAFGRDWAGAVFTGHVTPQKELRKYLRRAAGGYASVPGQGSRGDFGAKKDGGIEVPTQVFGGVS